MNTNKADRSLSDCVWNLDVKATNDMLKWTGDYGTQYALSLRNPTIELSGLRINDIWLRSLTRSAMMVYNVDVKSVRVIKDTNGKSIGTIVTFKNGDKQKALVSGGDTFDLDTGLGLCIAKEMSKVYYGNSNYILNQIHKAHKVYDKECAEKSKEELDKLQRKINQKKKEELAHQRAVARKEKQIEILTEALKRANMNA